MSQGLSPIALDNSAYTIGWIAALPHERAAAEAMLDQRHAPPQHKHGSDNNIYTLGSISGRNGEHNVVIASLPGQYGLTPATTAAMHLIASFPAIKIGLMVGIGGGIPSEENDIRLGDVVVSKPQGNFGGVRQYDFGKAEASGFVERGSLNSPSRVLLNAMVALQSEHESRWPEIPSFLEDMYERYPMMSRPRQGPGYTHQGIENDKLFESDYEHIAGQRDCSKCNRAREIEREERLDHHPFIHYGTIASGNQVIKDAEKRSLLAEDCLCFETEAAGLMNDFPCLVIRGICDYCDTHKNKRWQRYAAATAAAYAKELLRCIDVTDIERTPEVAKIMGKC